MARAPTPKRYAQAVFQIALEQGEPDRWLEDLRRVRDALQDEALRTYLRLPRVRLEQKIQVIRETLKDISPLAQNLVGLLTSRSSLELFSRLLEEYQRLLDAHLGRERGEVVTAVPLEGEQQERIGKLMEELVGKEVLLTARVEPQIMGGVWARVGDRVLDGTTRARLEGLKRKLVEEVPV